MMNLSTDSLKKIDEIVTEHKDKKGPVKLMLHDVQKQIGYIPFEAMEKISIGANVPIAAVFGVVSFYTQFTTEPKGKHVINICLGTACYVRGSQPLLDRVKILTNAPVNGTSKDNMFSLDATRCLGACGLAPVAVLDEQVYGNANNNKDLENAIRRIIKEENTPRA
jgi:NADH:ubiquinone oxidoreductase subunit E